MPYLFKSWLKIIVFNNSEWKTRCQSYEIRFLCLWMHSHCFVKARRQGFHYNYQQISCKTQNTLDLDSYLVVKQRCMGQKPREKSQEKEVQTQWQNQTCYFHCTNQTPHESNYK